MRWIPFVIFCYVAAALQVARLGLLARPGESYPMPEYVVLLAVFYAMYAADEAAMLVGLLCGILLDLLSSSMLGTLAVPLAITGFLIVKVRLSVFREHMISQGIIAAAGVLVFGGLVMAERWVLTVLVKADGGMILTWSFFVGNLENAVYTGVLAPAVFWVLLRMEGFLGFGLRGPRARGK